MLELKAKTRACLLVAAVCASGAAAAQNVTVNEPWVRGTVPQQKATGAFMQLVSDADATLVGAQSSVAGKVELHTTIMQDGVAKMRPVPRLDLPANKPVSLVPGEYHIMLLDLKQPLEAGQSVPITLVVEGRDKQVKNVEVQAEVRAVSGAAAHQH